MGKKQNWKIELEKGNIWRAKEILRGHIAQKYDEDEYFAYGKILYECHDLYEAGKYLFCAGIIDEKPYTDAVHLFLERNKNVFILNQLPQKFSCLSFEKMPKRVQEYFLSICGKDVIEKINSHHRFCIQSNEEELYEYGWKDKLYNLYGSIFLILFLVVMIVGFITSVRWLLNLTVSDQTKCIQDCGKWDDDKQQCYYERSEVLKSLNPLIRKIDR